MKQLLSLLAVSTLLLASAPALAMRVDVPGDRTRACDDSKSPVIRLTKVPEGTASLKVRIRSVSDWTDIPTSKVIDYRGVNRIEKGALHHFVRCRLDREAFGKGAVVEIRVQARDASGRVIASARDNAYYSSW